MADDGQKRPSLDLGPYNQAVDKVAEGTVRGAGAFLGRICLPAAEELGLYLRDKVREWRNQNAVLMVDQARQLAEARGLNKKAHAHPRLVMRAVDEASWIDNETLRGMWSGLLVSSCTADGQDDSNLVFMSIVNQLNSSEAKLIEYVVRHSEIEVVHEHWPFPRTGPRLSQEQLMEIMSINDVQQLDRELDHLIVLGLTRAGSQISVDEMESEIEICATALGLYLVYRCRGHRTVQISEGLAVGLQ